MRKNERGSVTLEAAISLVMLMAVMLTLNIFIKVTYVHGIVQHALIQTANEMATYDYILSLLGVSALNDAVMNKTQGNAGQATENLNTANQLIQSVDKTMDDFSGIMDTLGQTENNEGTAYDMKGVFTDDTSGISDITGSISELGEDISSVGEYAQGFYNTLLNSDGKLDLKGLLKSYMYAAIGEGASAAKTVGLNLVTKALLRTYILQEVNGTKIDVLEKNLVVDGISGLDFSTSTYFDYPDTDEIELCCTYMIKVVSPIPIIEYVPMINKVKVRAWQDKWSDVTLKAKTIENATSWWFENISEKSLNEKAITALGINNNLEGGSFDSYNEHTKTVTYIAATNLVKTTGDFNFSNYLTKQIRNLNNNNKYNGVPLEKDDIETVKFIIAVPSTKSLEASETGIALTNLKNQLAQENVNESPNKDTVSSLKKQIEEKEKELKEKADKLEKKTKELKQKAAEQESNFNSEGNYCKIQISVQALDGFEEKE